MTTAAASRNVVMIEADIAAPALIRLMADITLSRGCDMVAVFTSSSGAVMTTRTRSSHI